MCESLNLNAVEQSLQQVACSAGVHYPADFSRGLPGLSWSGHKPSQTGWGAVSTPWGAGQAIAGATKVKSAEFDWMLQNCIESALAALGWPIAVFRISRNGHCRNVLRTARPAGKGIADCRDLLVL